MASPNTPKPTSTSPAGAAKTLQRRPARRDMSNPDPTARRIPIPSMLRSATLQPRPRPTPPPPTTEPERSTGPYTPFANRGPYVVDDPGPYWLRLDDSEPEPESSPTMIQRRKTFADRGPYVLESTVRADVVPDRSPTVSPVSMLELPRFDIGSRVSLGEISEVSVRSVKGSIHQENSKTSTFKRTSPSTSSTTRARATRLQNLTPEEAHDRFQDPIENDGRFDDPVIPMRNVLTRSGTIHQEPMPDPIRVLPKMSRSQSLYMLPTLANLPAAYSLTYEERFDIFAGFDGIGRQRTPFDDESEGDGSSVVAQASLTRESTPVYQIRGTGGREVQRVERMPSNPEFGPVRFERSRTGLSFLNFDGFEGGIRVVTPEGDVGEVPSEVEEAEVEA
ncbi:uncharacterized protein H6S33_011091 [Morchella sextelata]|uniref:uncharacterized protein n=1 Tax=Morchella sextelata TaxID=1174677 RepID=UPI001D055495|nr:uncharacterized protein H6S33_011091 [Morchella sextelata]KAH0611826.1 hypothetical protein H6S33_011091 [Morchella sextelata]